MWPFSSFSTSWNMWLSPKELKRVGFCTPLKSNLSLRIYWPTDWLSSVFPKDFFRREGELAIICHVCFLMNSVCRVGVHSYHCSRRILKHSRCVCLFVSNFYLAVRSMYKYPSIMCFTSKNDSIEFFNSLILKLKVILSC